MNTPQPTISVTLPSYNHGRYLRQCFAGLLRQTFRDFEVVVTDDGSTDGSQSIIAKFAQQDSRIKVNYFEKNRGVRVAWNDIWNRTQGELLFAHAADDFIVDEGFFERAVQALTTHPQAAGFYGIVGLYSAEKDKLVGMMGSALATGYNPPLDCYAGFLKSRAIVTGTSLVLRRELIAKHGGYDFSLGPQADLYLAHLLASKYGMVFEKKAVTCQRVYEKRTNYGASGSLWEMVNRFAELERRLRQLGTTYPEMEEDWRNWRAIWALDCVRKTGINAGLLQGVPPF